LDFLTKMINIKFIREKLSSNLTELDKHHLSIFIKLDFIIELC